LYPPIVSTFFRNNSVDNSRENLVVTVSRFGFGKGLETIPYIAKLTKENVKFVMIGVVHDQNIMQSIYTNIKKFNVSHKVEVLTNISKQQVKDILERAKIYMHTTVNEHFGISIAEAMAMGCIPIVHNSGGVKEFVPADYRYNNIRDAAHKIETCINDWTPNKASEMLQIAERFKEDTFSNELLIMFNKYEQTRRP
jgi:alpha-1,2-mannosyltransferase